MKALKLGIGLVSILLLNACISDDYIDDNIDPVLNIISSIDTLEINTDFVFEYKYFNNVGQSESTEVSWSSADPNIIDIDATGLATAFQLGSTHIYVETIADDLNLIDSIEVAVGEMTTFEEVIEIIEGAIVTTSSYKLEGDFVFEATETGVELSFKDNYSASTALPGLYIYLSNNNNSIANAYEIGKVETFEGEHKYEIPNLGFTDYAYIVYYCKPFNVKVGEGTF